LKNLRIMSAVGARPNFMKIAPFTRALHAAGFEHFLVHTGQHYDASMSASFFEDLGIPEPDVDLGVGSGSHAEQVGQTMMAFEKVVRDWRPDWIVVVGDVNATCACSITAKKEHVKLAHIEAGLRSFDAGMPEEINRIITDRLSDLLFTPDEFGDRNLRNEGVAEDRIRRVGNIMIDTLEANRARASRLSVEEIVRANLVTSPGHAAAGAPGGIPAAATEYALLTMHRPSNVDRPETLERLTDLFAREVSKELPLLWILHPRTRARLESFGLWESLQGLPGLFVLHPVGYRDLLRLNLGARVVFTDSGGLQEECCVLGTPCITLREHTERPVTLRENGGVSELAGNDTGRIAALLREMAGQPRRECRPALWDGRTAERIVKVFAELAK
jgi:UDP-N-acetylglucosamine 2-epimerase (non-hydrolysing)